MIRYLVSSPAPEAGSQNPKTYYVYHLPPTSTNPHWHYGYFNTNTPTQDLPDIRHHKPQWIYNDVTRHHTTVDPRMLWVKQSRAKRFAARVSQRLREVFGANGGGSVHGADEREGGGGEGGGDHMEER